MWSTKSTCDKYTDDYLFCGDNNWRQIIGLGQTHSGQGYMRGWGVRQNRMKWESVQ